MHGDVGMGDGWHFSHNHCEVCLASVISARKTGPTSTRLVEIWTTDIGRTIIQSSVLGLILFKMAN